MFEQEIQRYENALLKDVIPFWESHGIDTVYGGYFDSLDREGSIYDTDKWMWMQWRKVYQFATLYTGPYKQKRWLAIAQQGFDFLTKFGKDNEGMYYFGLNRKGEPIVAPYNIYSEAFAMMGSAALYKATKEEKYKREALSAMDHYISRMKNPKGKWEKSQPAKKQRLNLGVYMIYANLANVIQDCLGVTQYETKAAECVDIVVNRFWNLQYNVLFENINPDFSFDLESSDGRHINPGHGLESMWFIMQYGERVQNAEFINKAALITQKLLEFGWDPEFGGIFYFLDVLGKPHSALEWDMKLWWVHNEAILAILFAYRLTGKKNLLDWFKKVNEWTWDNFPDPKFGEWFGYLNRRGEPTHMLKGSKWKCFFHLPRFLLTGIEQMKLIDKQELTNR